MKLSSHILQFILALVLCLGFISPSLAQEPEKLFQQGLVKEEGEGSLEEAIKIYTRVVDDVSAERSLRAKALLQVGICYEKLGQEKARASYEKLISEYADQEEVVAMGKKKLAYLSTKEKVPSSGELTITQVWAPSHDTYGVSPDGRYLNYIDWVSIELAVKDLKTGEGRNVTDRGTWKPPMQFPDKSVWSPDSKKLAYFWYYGDSTQLRILNIDGSGNRLLCTGRGLQTPWPIAWSPDGSYILALGKLPGDTSTDENNGHLVAVSVEDGSIRLLKELEPDQADCCGSISPDGQSIAYPLKETGDSNKANIYLLSEDGSSETLVVENPAHDTDPVWRPDGNGIVFKSDRTGTESLWEQDIVNGQAEGKPRLLKANLNKRTKLLGFSKDGALFYSVNNFRTDVFIASMDFRTGEILSEPKRITTSDDARHGKAAWSPDGRYVLYSAFDEQHDPEFGRTQKLLIYDTQTGKTRTLDTEFYAAGPLFWTRPMWSTDASSILFHGRSVVEGLQGFFQIDVKSGDWSPVLVKELEPINHSTPVGYYPQYSKDGAHIFYLSADKTDIMKRNLATHQETVILAGEDQLLQLYLSPDGSQLIFRYFFTDSQQLFSVSAEGGAPETLMEMEDLKPYVVDWVTEDLMLIETGFYDETLDNDIIWRKQVDKSAEQVILMKDLLQRAAVQDMDVHPDGRQILISAMIGQGQQIWKMENLFSNNK